MANKYLDDVAAKPLHADAATAAIRYVENFAVSLVLQSKLLAHGQSDEIVLRRHVDTARTVLRRQEEDRGWWKQILGVFGSAAFGVGVSNFVREGLADPLSMPRIAGFTALMLVGAFTIAWQLRR